MKVNLGLYMNARRSYTGSGQLNPYAVRNIEQLLRLRSQGGLVNLNVEVLLARDNLHHWRPTPDAMDTKQETHWTDAFAFDPLSIKGDFLKGPPTGGTPVQGKGANLLREATLTGFVSKVRGRDTEAPNVLVLWGHADGPRGFLFSMVSKPQGVFERDILSPLEVELALKKSGEGLPPLKLLCMDSCQGACLEFACVLPDFAEYFVASQTPVPGTGWNYESWPGILDASKGKQWREIAAEIAYNFATSNPENSSISVIDLKKVGKVSSLLGQVTRAFLKDASACQKLMAVRKSIPTPGGNRSGLVDVSELFFQTANRLQRGPLFELCRKLDDAMRDATDTTLPAINYVRDFQLSGCSIFFPIPGESYGGPWHEITKKIYFDDKQQLSSFRKTKWPELMRKLVPSAARDLPHP